MNHTYFIMKSHPVRLIICLLFSLFSPLLVFSADYEQRTNLPTFYITTNDGQHIISKTDYKAGKLTIVSSDPTEEMTEVTMQIRGRGNSTWTSGRGKDPYRMKLDKKANLLNLPAKEKDWVLLANALDPTLVRNALAFKIGEILGMETNPSARFVDVYLNNKFMGNYMVTDQVEVASAAQVEAGTTNRVPVEKQELYYETGVLVTGGYLMEIDGFRDGNSLRNTRVPIVLKYPDKDEVNTAQFNYIQNYISDFESRLFGENFGSKILGYRAKVDTVSLINWYIACELTANYDSFWQTYIYKKRSGDHLYFGPLWDYDRVAFQSGDATKNWMREKAYAPRQWIERFWQDEWFQRATWRRWQQVVNNGLYEQLEAYLDELEEMVGDSYDQNNTQWYKAGSLSSHISSLKTYLKGRIDFLTMGFYMKEDFEPEEQYYKISNIKTNTFITAQHFSGQANDSIMAWQAMADGANDDQLWTINSVGGGWYNIINKKSGLAISGNGMGLTGHGRKLKLAQLDPSDEMQQWSITEIGTTNTFGIVNKQSTYTITNLGGSAENGNKIVEWSNNYQNNINQKWKLTTVSSVVKKAARSMNAVIHDIVVSSNSADYDASISCNISAPADITINISDMLGTQIRSYTYTQVSGDQYFRIPVFDIQSGIYSVTISIQGGESYTEKLIVQ